MKRNNFSAIFFDLDGTLVESHLNFSQMKKDLNFPEDCNILEYIETLSDEAQKKKASQIIHEHEISGAKASHLFTGVPELLEHINLNDIPTGIITRNSSSTAHMTLRTHNLDFKYVYTRDNSPAKPNPTALLDLCRTFKVDPAKALYIGDYIYDIDTAKNAKALAGLYLNDFNQELKAHSDVHISCYKEFLDTIK